MYANNNYEGVKPHNKAMQPPGKHFIFCLIQKSTRKQNYLLLLCKLFAKLMIN